MISVNLIPTRRQVARARGRHLRFWAGTVGAWAGVVGLGVLGARIAIRAEDGVLARQIESAKTELQDSKTTAGTVRTDLQRVRQELEIVQAVGPLPDWSVLLAALADCVADDVVLRTVRLDQILPVSTPPPPTPGSATPQPAVDPEGYTMFVSGLGRTQTAVSQLALRLEQIGVFSKVKLLETQREAFLDGEAIRFRIECVISEEGSS